MSTADRCPRCGAPRAGSSPGTPCPACLMQLGLAGAGPELGEFASGATEAGAATREFRAGAAEVEQPVPTPEQIAPHFPELEVLNLLGQGGMGAVYKARQRALDRLVALKIIRPQSARDPGFAARFAREARALARLSHPHIVAIHDFGQRDGLYFLIMEYVDGINLRQMMQEGQLLPEQALSIVPRLCETLQYAHDEGVIHRDIKPENILLDRRGRVKIADFGLAKLAGDKQGDGTLTGCRQVIGTPSYMAPEQMRGSTQVDHRADIYSLGVVLYEMLTGELPIGRFERPSQRVPVDGRLDDVVLRTLERDPERRYQHAVDVKTDIESIASDAHGSTVGRPRGVEADVQKQISSPRFCCHVSTVALLLLVAVGACQFVTSGLSLWHMLRVLATGHVALLPVALGLLARSAAMGTGLLALLGGVLAWRGDYVWPARLGALALMLPTSGTWLVGLPAGIGLLWATRTRPLPAKGPLPDAIPARESRRVRLRDLMGAAVILVALVGAFFALRHWTTYELREASRAGSAASVRWWLWLGGSPNSPDNGGMTPLMWAALEGHHAVVTSLIMSGAVVDATTSFGETALMMSAFGGHTEAVGVLLGAGADPARPDRDGENALMRAAGNGHLAVVDLLIGSGAPVDVASQTGMTPLLWAAWQGHGTVVRRLVRAGANVRERSADGETALMKAAYHGYDDLVSELLALGCTINTQDEDGETALLLAAATGSQSTVAVLLQRGADLSLATRKGTTALMIAARNGHLPVVRQLLTAGSDVDVRNNEGLTALDEAMLGGQTATAEALIAAGAPTDGRFALWQACREIRQGGFLSALPLLERAAQQTTTPVAPWRWSIDPWDYQIPAPAVLVWLLVGESRRQSGQMAAAAEAFGQALAAVHSQGGEALLVRRTVNAPDQSSVVQEFRVFSAQLQNMVTRPGPDGEITLHFPSGELALQFHEEQRWRGGNSSRSGQPAHLADLFR